MGLSLGIRYTGVSLMFGAALLVLWLLLAGYRIKNLPAKALLTLTGHLRARPDPWLECALRTALADFDRELTTILQDRGIPPRPAAPPRPAGPARPAQPGRQESGPADIP